MENWMQQAKKSLEEYDFTVEYETEGIIRIGKFSSAGQDFSFTVEVGQSLEDLRDSILSRHDSFDVSEEAHEWLDDSGHGKNGAPYDMKEVYEDMEECKGYIYDAFCIVRDLAREQKPKGKTLMQRLHDAGYGAEDFFHHESDLYIYATEKTKRVVLDWCNDNGYSPMLFMQRFRDQVTGKPMYDIPFQYDPHWEEKCGRGAE